jgi:hypothetical protein
MAVIFISHLSVDNAAAIALRDWNLLLVALASR